MKLLGTQALLWSGCEDVELRQHHVCWQSRAASSCTQRLHCSSKAVYEKWHTWHSWPAVLTYLQECTLGVFCRHNYSVPDGAKRVSAFRSQSYKVSCHWGRPAEAASTSTLRDRLLACTQTLLALHVCFVMARQTALRRTLQPLPAPGQSRVQPV